MRKLLLVLVITLLFVPSFTGGASDKLDASPEARVNTKDLLPSRVDEDWLRSTATPSNWSSVDDLIDFYSVHQTDGSLIASALDVDEIWDLDLPGPEIEDGLTVAAWGFYFNTSTRRLALSITLSNESNAFFSDIEWEVTRLVNEKRETITCRTVRQLAPGETVTALVELKANLRPCRLEDRETLAITAVRAVRLEFYG